MSVSSLYPVEVPPGPEARKASCAVPWEGRISEPGRSAPGNRDGAVSDVLPAQVMACALLLSTVPADAWQAELRLLSFLIVVVAFVVLAALVTSFIYASRLKA